MFFSPLVRTNLLSFPPFSTASRHGKHRDEVVQIPFSTTPKPTKTLTQNIDALICCDQPSITDPCRSPHQLHLHTTTQISTSLQRSHANASHRTPQNYQVNVPRTLWLKLPSQAPTFGHTPEIQVLPVRNKLFLIHTRLARAPTPADQRNFLSRNGQKRPIDCPML